VFIITLIVVNINGEMIEIRETLHQYVQEFIYSWYVPTKSVGSSREFVEKYISVWW